MLTTTAADIITQARSAADAETPTPTTDFVTDAELLLVLTREYRKLVDAIVAFDGGMELLATSTTLTSPYALPADFYRAAAVDVPGKETGTWATLKQFSFQRRNDYCDTTRPRYRIVAGALVFSPSTAAPSSVRLWYVAAPAALASGAATVLSANGFEDYLIYTLAAYICRKEDRDEGAHQQSRGEAMQRIKTACKALVVVDTKTIADVERQPEEFFDRWV